MLFVGVDVSTSKFDVAVMNQQFKVLASKSFSFDSDGFSQFVSFLKKFNEPVSIAMEASGSFTFNLFDFLNEHNFNVFILHPYFVKKHSDSKSKTDPIDARQIADVCARFFDKLSDWSYLDEDTLALRDLVRFRYSLVESSANLQKKFKNILRSYLPEVLNFFSQLDSKVLLELLSNFPSKQAIVKNEQQVIQLLSSFKNWNEQKAKAFVNAIKRSIGRKDKLKVAQTIILSITQQLKQIKEQVQAIDEQIKQLMEQFDQTNFPDIPGIGDATKATIISEVGDIEKFESKKKFVSYIGLDPVIHQSGKSTKHKGISKKGNKVLRRIFYNLAIRAIRLIEKYKKKYQELIARGKKPKQAIIAIARKLAELVWILWTRKESFDISKV